MDHAARIRQRVPALFLPAAAALAGVPRWLAVLFLAGLEVAQQASSAGPVVILYMLPFAAAILLSARIWQAAARPATSDLVSASGPAPSSPGGEEGIPRASTRPVQI